MAGTAAQAGQAGQAGHAPEASANGHESGARERVMPTTPLAQRSLSELFATLGRDIGLLIHQEIQLAKTELKSALLKSAVGAAGLLAAAVALVFSLPLLAVAVAFGIHALGVTLGWSFFIVGGAFVAVALFAAAIGSFALRRAKPRVNAMASMKSDLHALARKPNPVPPVR
jgi:hypothetical protein